MTIYIIGWEVYTYGGLVLLSSYAPLDNTLAKHIKTSPQTPCTVPVGMCVYNNIKVCYLITTLTSFKLFAFGTLLLDHNLFAADDVDALGESDGRGGVANELATGVEDGQCTIIC